ncbi:hypothetical protein AAHA92_12203 [Salvia divinorum]|uniref:Uncharacterized protein n=1 Tax=Salvia divinorum TaxID=28513 RepID=A0ABD1HJH7_SALDI
MPLGSSPPHVPTPYTIHNSAIHKHIIEPLNHKKISSQFKIFTSLPTPTTQSIKGEKRKPNSLPSHSNSQTADV